MKRAVTVIIPILLLAACGDAKTAESPDTASPAATNTPSATNTTGPTNTPAPPTNTPTPKPTATPTPNPKPKLGVTTEAKGSRYTVNEVREIPATRYGSPPAGKRWVAIDVTQEAVSATDPFNSFYFFLQDEQSFRYSVGFVIGGPDPAFGSGDLAQGQKVRGWTAFEIPADAKLVSVLAQPDALGGTIIIADLTQ